MRDKAIGVRSDVAQRFSAARRAGVEFRSFADNNAARHAVLRTVPLKSPHFECGC